MTISAILILVVAVMIALSRKRPEPEPTQEPSRREAYVQEQEQALAKVNDMIMTEQERVREIRRNVANAKLQFAMAQADFDIAFLDETLDDLNESFEKATADALKFRNAGDEKREEQAKQKVMVQRNKIHAAQKKLAKAKFDKGIAEYQLYA